MVMTEGDLLKLHKVLESIEKGTATTYDKAFCVEVLKGILEPKCSICRGVMAGDLIVVGGRKMHAKCKSRYRG